MAFGKFGTDRVLDLVCHYPSPGLKKRHKRSKIEVGTDLPTE